MVIAKRAYHIAHSAHTPYNRAHRRAPGVLLLSPHMWCHMWCLVPLCEQLKGHDTHTRTHTYTPPHTAQTHTHTFTHTHMQARNRRSFSLFLWCHVPLCEQLNRQDHTHTNPHMHPHPHASTHQACFFCLFLWCHVPLCERLNRQDHPHKPTNAPTPTYKHAPGVFLLSLPVVPRPLVRATQQARSHTQTHKCTHTHMQARTRRVSSVSSRGATSPRVSNSKGGACLYVGVGAFVGLCV